jgi:drug/metabolite transporter (DMT)-like permease
MSTMHSNAAKSHLLPAIAVSLCGAVWGTYWYPLRWFETQGVGGAWVSLIFNVVAAVATLPLLMRAAAWRGFGREAVTGLMLGGAFSLYTISVVMTDVLHALLLFYLTPVWSTVAVWLLFGERLSLPRLMAMAFGFAGLCMILGVTSGLPLPRNAGDIVALASGMLWAAGTLRSYFRPSHGIALPVFAFSFGGLISSTIILCIAGHLAAPVAEAGNLLAVAPWIVALSLIIFVPPNYLVLWAAQRIDSGRIGILLMTEVIVGAISASLFSGEHFGPAELAGTLLIVCAGLVEVFGRR